MGSHDVDYNIYDKMQHKDRLCKELYNKTHDTMREDLNESKMGDQINEKKMDKRHGLKTYSKQKKIDVKNILESEEKKVRVGEKGIFVRGRIFEDKTTFTADRDKQIIEKLDHRNGTRHNRSLDENTSNRNSTVSFLSQYFSFMSYFVGNLQVKLYFV